MSTKAIHFSQHALLKFQVLSAHGLDLDETLVSGIVSGPDAVSDGYGGRKVAQGPLDKRRVLRVVYEERADDILIVTFYPGRRERYEKGQI